MRSPTELTTRIMKEAIGGLSLVKFDTSGYSLTNNIRFFSRDKCLQFNKIKQIKAKTVKNLICPIKRNQTETCKNGASFPTIHQLPTNYLIFHQKMFPNPVYNNNIIKQKKSDIKNGRLMKRYKTCKSRTKRGQSKVILSRPLSHNFSATKQKHKNYTLSPSHLSPKFKIKISNKKIINKTWEID